MNVLGQLEKAELATHKASLVAKLNDPDLSVRNCARGVLETAGLAT